MYETLSLYIDGEFIQGGRRREQDVFNPATNYQHFDFTPRQRDPRRLR